MGKKYFRILTALILCVLQFMIACTRGGEDSTCGGGISGSSSVTVTHLAGPLGGYGSADGTGAAAEFWKPSGITSDGINLYVADTENHTIRKIVIATGEVTTLAGTAGISGSTDGTGAAALFHYPRGITNDGTSLYVVESFDQIIRKIVIATGEVTTFAGTAYISGSTDGIGAVARFNSPWGITTDGTNLYVADTNNQTIRKIVIATREVTTFAGTADNPGSTDGTGAAARFSYPSGITNDGTNLYVADAYNYTIRKIVISTGEVTTLAGTAGSAGSTDDTGAAARFNYPADITTDGINLYVADSWNYTIRKIVIATAEVTTVAGKPSTLGATDGTGAAARFDHPYGITNSGTNLYVADTENHTIRKIVIATGEVTTLAGMASGTGFADGTGAAARFSGPSGITTDGTNLFVTDTENHTIRKIVTATGQVMTLAGMAGNPGFTDGTGAAARFNNPSGITTDGINLYVADTDNHIIRKIVIATGEVTTLAGFAGNGGNTDGTGAAARFSYPAGITTDGTNLYVADTNNHIIRKIVIETGAATTFAGPVECFNYTNCHGNAGCPSCYGSADGIGAEARFTSPYGITSDGTNLYVTDKDKNTIRKIVIATAEVRTLAGTAGTSGSTDCTGAAASFKYPAGITNDGINLYVADGWNGTIRKIVIATGEVTTLAGTAGNYGYTDGTGATARFNFPDGLASDGASIYVADTNNNAIRKISM